MNRFRIAVVTMTCPRYSGIAEVSLPNMKEYCDIHGYLNSVIQLPETEGFHYKKHEFFKEAFKTDIQAIFYKDIDTVITNMTIPLDAFISDDHDLMITKDVGGINGGSLIIKNSEGGRWVNDFILTHRHEFNNEQEVIDHYIDDPEFSKFVKILPHPSINSYKYSAYPELTHITDRHEGNWHEGDFLLHTPALSFEQRIEILKTAKIIK